MSELEFKNLRCGSRVQPNGMALIEPWSWIVINIGKELLTIQHPLSRDELTVKWHECVVA